MANATSEQRIGEEPQQRVGGERGVVAGGTTLREAGRSGRVSRPAVEGGATNEPGRDDDVVRSSARQEDAVRGRRLSGAGARSLPPPHAWLAIDDTTRAKHRDRDSDPDEQWLRLLRGGGTGRHQHHHPRRSSFSVLRRERAAREAWLDSAWEVKRSWHARNGGAPDADTPVVVVVGKAHHATDPDSDSPPSAHHHAPAGGVAMDVDEVRACRDLGLELPSDCTVEIQCFGLSSDGSNSPTHAADGSSGGADSPCAGISSPGGADPMDVKARLKVWAQAVALTSTTQLGS